MSTSTERILDLLDDRLDDADRIDLEREIAADPVLRDRVEEIRRLRSALRAGPLPAPASALTDAAVELWRQQSMAATRLLFDSFATPVGAGAGLRAGDRSVRRRLRFANDQLEVDVEMQLTDEGLRVRGEIADATGDGVPLAGATVSLTASPPNPNASPARASVQSAPDGTFVVLISGAPPWTLEASSKRARIVCALPDDPRPDDPPPDDPRPDETEGTG